MTDIHSTCNSCNMLVVWISLVSFRGRSAIYENRICSIHPRLIFILDEVISFVWIIMDSKFCDCLSTYGYIWICCWLVFSKVTQSEALLEIVHLIKFVSFCRQFLEFYTILTLFNYIFQRKKRITLLSRSKLLEISSISFRNCSVRIIYNCLDTVYSYDNALR